MSDVYYKKQPSCTLPDGTEWFAGAAGDSSTLRVCTQVPIVAKNPTATNSEYIEREAAERILESVGAPAYAVHALILVKTADVVPVVHGRWVNIQNGKGCCSECHRLDAIDPIATHCRYCGARMDGDG